jgi:two-component system sensor histidine kinase SenX3
LLGAFVGVLVGAVAVLLGTRRASASAEQPAPPAGPTSSASLPPEVVAVLGALRAGSVVVDSSGSVLWASASVRAWGIVDPQRVIDDRVAAAVRATRSTGEPRSVDLELRRRRGGPRVLLSVRTTILDGERTLVLVEDRSQEARVDDVRRDFVANVSHELKTPVGALSLLAEAVEGAADDSEAVQRFAARMRHEAARLTAMVNDLIELSRLQGDHLEEHAGPVAVDVVVADAIDFVRTRAHARAIELRGSGRRGLVVHGDQAQLTTALRNLLDNAVSYSPERTRVVVDVRAAGDRVEISVADQGIGISEADQARIFERFYRVDPARSRATGGTGLGLAIVRHVCVNHGGEVTVWSTEGAGSTFTLRLPVEAAPASDRTTANGATSTSTSPHGPHVRRAVP